MKKWITIIIVFLSVTSVSAEEVSPKAPLKAAGTSRAELDAVRLGNELLRYGYANQSAVSLLGALQIFAENPTQPLRAEFAGPEDKADGIKGGVSFDYDEVIADARRFAYGDQTVLALIADAEAELESGVRGAANGPARVSKTLPGNSVHSFTIPFVSGYLAEVLVSGDGVTDIDLVVCDSRGKEIVSDVTYSSNCYVQWVPSENGEYVVKVVNRGPASTKYVLLTN